MKISEQDKSKFKFQYLPDYAKFLLKNKLDEFGIVGIRFCREVDLPMMRPLAKFSEQELLQISLEGNREMLTSLAQNDICPFIEKNIEKIVTNNITDNSGKRLLDQTDVLIEDIILGFYIRRKLFNFFLHSYTPNAVVHMLISAEVDFYTTQEHLLTSKTMIATGKV